MSGLFDQVVNYSPPLLTAGQVNYKGTWNAATNTPGLANPPDALSKGDYYVVSADGTQFSISFAVGDWIISNGTAWEKVDLTDAVSSVFGRTGAVVGVSTDYSAVGLTDTAIGASSPSSGAFTSLSSSSTTTLNGTTVPASKTLVVTTDKLSALAATTSAELAGVISDETGSGALVFASSPTLVTPALGTPSALVGTNITGTASGLTAGNVTTNANLTGAITSVGNATSLGSFTSANLASALTDETGSGANVFATSPTLVTPILGTPQSGTLTSCTGLPISTGVSGLGTGIATALAVNTGSAGAPVLFNGALGTPTSGTVTNLTGTASININGTVGATTPTTGVFTGLTVNDNTTLGSSNSDTVNFNARVASDLNPSTDNTYDLGVTGHEWRNLNIDGTANIDSLVADTADINGGTIDGTAIGSGTASTGAFTTLSASGLLTVASNVLIGSASPASDITTVQLFQGSNVARNWRLAANVAGGEFTITPSTAGGGTTYTTPIVTVTTAGAAVTGALSASGDSKISKSTPVFTIESTAVDTLGKLAFFDSAAGATSAFLSAGNNGGNFLTSWNRGGVDGAAEYIKMDAFPRVIIGVGGSNVGVFTSTGLAVTGALSATTGLTLNDGTANSPNLNFQTTSGTRIMDMDGSTIRILNMAASNARLQLTDAGDLTIDGALTINNTVATAVAVASTHKVTIVIGGVTYYLLATNV
jgi:hypothetical protein